MLLFTAAIAGWLILLNQSIDGAVGGAALIGLGLGGIGWLLFGERARPTAFEAPAFVITAWMITAALSLLFRATGLHGSWALLALAVAAFALRGLRGKLAMPSPPSNTPPLSGLSRTLCVLAAVGVFAPPAVYGYLMGHGDAPQIFLNADNAYHLSQVHALLRDASVPPASLAVSGETRIYNFGAQEMAALLTRMVPKLPAHTAFFGLLLPMVALAQVSAAWLLARRVADRVPAPLIVALPLFIDPPTPVLRAVEFAKGGWGGSNLELLLVRHVPHQLAAFVLMIVIAVAFSPRMRRWWFMAMAALAALSITRTSSFLGIGTGVGMMTLFMAWRQGRWQPLGPPLAALAAAIPLLVELHLLSGEGGGLTFRPLIWLRDGSWDKAAALWRILVPALDGDGLKAIAQTALFAESSLWTIILPGAIAGTLLWMSRQQDSRHVERGGEASLLFLALGPLLFVNLVSFERPGFADSLSMRTNLYTMTYFVPAVMVALLLQRFETATGTKTLLLMQHHWRKALTALGPIYAGGFSTLFALMVLLAPQKGEEYVDNRPLLDVLSRIPVQGTILATNDLRYPSRGMPYEGEQFQLNALFGHQTYLSVLTYEKYDDTERRTGLQARLRERHWPPDLTEIACREGWTHILLSLQAPHPAASQVPFPLIYENKDYRVYAVTCRSSLSTIKTFGTVGPHG